MIREVVMTTAAGEAQGVSVRRWVLPNPSTGMLFVLVVALHWVEHLVQAGQIHALGVAPAKALGAVGALVPGLVRSEWLHLAYNLALLVGLVVLRRLFTNRGWRLWHLAIAGQSWHLFEHLLLFAQAQTGARFFGTDAPSSVLQLFVPRADLHLTYNGAVTLLMLLAAFEPQGSAQRAALARPEWIQVDARGAVHRLPGDRHKKCRTISSLLSRGRFPASVARGSDRGHSLPTSVNVRITTAPPDIGLDGRPAEEFSIELLRFGTSHDGRQARCEGLSMGWLERRRQENADEAPRNLPNQDRRTKS